LIKSIFIFYHLNSLQLCGVSILRAGECLEPALSEVCKHIRLGKILIQTNLDTGEPEVAFPILFIHPCYGAFHPVYQLHYLRLPKDIKENHIMLMDATVATGAAAMMAIRILLDHDVPEENILLVSLLMAESGKMFIAFANAIVIGSNSYYPRCSFGCICFSQSALSHYCC
jgi:uridine kinase